MLAGTGMEAEYKRLSPTPNGLAGLIAKLRAMESVDYAWPEDRIRAMRAPTMVIVGDADGMQIEHAVKLFSLGGGDDRQAAVNGFCPALRKHASPCCRPRRTSA
jgi:hypothetical protein